ncbi:MAG: glycosyltransferase family 4 protein [Chloroflexota bacterium]
MRILFLSRWYPYPPDNGSKIRVFNLLRQLSVSHEVFLIAFSGKCDRVDADTLAALRDRCVAVRAVAYPSLSPSRLRTIVGLLSTQPRFLVETFTEGVKNTVREELGRLRYDLLVASELDMVPYALGQKDVPALFEELQLTPYRDAIRREHGFAPKTRRLLTWWKLSQYLRRILPRFAACTVVSQLEMDNVKAVAPGYDRVEVVPNAIDLGHYDGDFGSPQTKTLIFSGALTYDANFDAVAYFLTNIYPRIRQAVPDLKFRITGRVDGVDLLSLPRAEGVEYTGYLQDIRPAVAKSWATVVPLRFGGGTRLKILESMALGTPVVSTSKGAEGLDVADGDNIIIADEPGEFADKVTELLRSPELRRRLASGGRELVASRYDWDTVGKTLREVVERAVVANAR